jgi:hypothetical protein
MDMTMEAMIARLHTRDDRWVLCGRRACNARLGTVVRVHAPFDADYAPYADAPGRCKISLGRGWKQNDFGVYVRGSHALKRMRQGLEPKDRRSAYALQDDELVAAPKVTEIRDFPARVRCDTCNAINVLDVKTLRLIR